MKRLLIMILALTSTSAVWAKDAATDGDFAVETFEQALACKGLPLSLKLKDLDGSWRRFSAGGSSEAMNPAMMILAMSGGGGSQVGTVYYTKGHTITIGTDRFLIVYRAQPKPTDAAAAMAAMGRGQPPEAEHLTALTPLALSLLNLHQNISFADIHAFNLEAEISGVEAPAAEEDKGQQESNEASLKNLRLIGTALLTYVTERKVLPFMTDAKSAHDELVLYLRNPDVLNQPGTKTPYLPNAALSGHKTSEFDKPEKTIAFYETTSGADGTRGVLFLDGHAERIAEQQWKHLKEISHLP